MEFSVIIPTYNRPAQIQACMQAFLQLNFPGADYEILIIDDCSPNPVEDFVRDYLENLPLRVIRLEENSGPGVARNRGLAEATGRLVAFTDDDCEVTPQWLTAYWDCLDRNPGALAGGSLSNGVKGNIYSEASQVISDMVYAHFNRDPDNARFFSSNNMAAAREDLQLMEGFVTSYKFASEDRDLCNRWRHSGRKLVYCPDAHIIHHHVLSLRKFARQHFAYGKGAWAFQRARHRREAGNIGEDLSFHKSLMRLLPEIIGRRPARQWFGLLFLCGLWQVANLLGFLAAALSEATKKGERRTAPPDTNQ